MGICDLLFKFSSINFCFSLNKGNDFISTFDPSLRIRTEEIRSIPRGFGSYGDMVLILNDGSKVEMKSLPLFREKQKFIEENINKRSQIPNLNEVEGFATKS